MANRLIKSIVFIVVLLSIFVSVLSYEPLSLKKSASLPPYERENECCSVVILAEDGEYHGLGLIKKDPKTISKWKKIDTILFKSKYKFNRSSVINDTYLPPVGNQGSEGSCTAWASGYYTMTYTEGKARNWSDIATNSSHRFSPAFLYNQGRVPADRGLYLEDATEILSTLGCSSLNLMPYQAGQYTTWPSEDAYKEAMKYRVDPSSIVWIDTTEEGGLNAVKSWLDQGNIGFSSISIFNNFSYISDYGNNYCLADATGTNWGGHATTIIGYDDNRTTNDGTGAFKCVNSWGTNWGDSGFYWISYQAVTDTNKKIFDGFFVHYDVITSDPSYGCTLKFNYSQFRDLSISLSSGKGSIHLWDLLSWKDEASRGQSISPPAIVWVEVSQLVPSCDYTLSVCDGFNTNISGQITEFSITNLSDIEKTSSGDTPVSIVPLGSSVLISNGGFESNFDNWTPEVEGGGTEPSISTTKSHSGTNSAYLYADGTTAGYSYLFRSITLPSEPKALSLWYYPLYTGSAQGDAQYAYLEDNQGNFIGYFINAYSNEQVWKSAVCDLSYYKGQTVNLYIVVYHDGTSGASISMYVDDVGLCPVTVVEASLILPCPTITLTPSNLPKGYVSVPYSQSISGGGGTSPYSYEVTDGNLPDGLNLSTGGVLSGTPTTVGEFNFTITATDSCGCTGNITYSNFVIYPAEVGPGLTLETAITFSEDKETLNWPLAGGATEYKVYRINSIAELPDLLNNNYDSCTRYEGSLLSIKITDDPSLATDKIYFYLVTATNGTIEGPAGNATSGERIVNSTGNCP
jgi:C1A family cysteine protease